MLPAGAQIPADTLLQAIVTVKNSSSEYFYFGFHEKDKVLFSFEEIYGSSLRGFSFSQYGASEIFEQSNVGNIGWKELSIPNTGIYYFRLRQSGFLAGRRTCRLIVCRIPASEKQRDFNTTVYWEKKVDTVWYTEEERYLISRDTLVSVLAAQTLKLGRTKKDNSASVSFLIPPANDGWAWWICSHAEADRIFSEAEANQKDVNPVVRRHGLMAWLAMGGGAAFSVPPGARNVRHAFLTSPELQAFTSGMSPDSLQMKSGNLAFGSETDSSGGQKYLALCNNGKKKCSVKVNITSVKFRESWGTRKIRKFRLEEKMEPYLKD
jgi:hypothetical protein